MTAHHQHPPSGPGDGEVVLFRPRKPSPVPRAGGGAGDGAGDAGGAGELERHQPPPAGDMDAVELVDADGDGLPDTVHDTTPGALVERPAGGLEHQGPVLDAELVDEEPTALARITRPMRRMVVPAVRVARHEPTRRAGKAVLRNTAYILGGLVVVTKRWRDAHTTTVHQEMIRIHRAAGQYEQVADWEQREQQAKDRAHKRRMDLLKLPYDLAKALAMIVVVGGLGLLLLGVIIALANDNDFGLTLAPLLGAAEVIAWTAAAVVVVGGLLAIAAPFALVAGLWWVGKSAAATPRWLMAPGQHGRGDMMPSELTEDTITKALQDTVTEFDKAIKAGWKVRYRVPPRVDQGGTHFQLDLPPRAPVEAFVKRKDLLAHNLKRYPIEVWPTEPIAGVLDGWVADPGVLTKPVGPWPVLEDLENARCDYFKGSIPVSLTLRGLVVASQLAQKNFFMAGVMGSGKSTLAVTLVLGAMLDPLVDIDVVVMAENADYEPMRPRLRSLHTGIEEDTVEAAIHLLRDRFRSLGELGELLREQMDITAAQGREPDKFINREYAEREPRLRPRVIVVDECQNLFMSEHGRDAEIITKKLITTARKYATTLIFLTPDPTGDAVPTGVVRVMSNKSCFPIGDQIGNDAALGTGSHKTGLTAVNLVPAIDGELNDAGTAAARGFTAQPGMMRCFYVPQSDAHRVTKRAMQLLEEHNGTVTREKVEERDLLADLADVLVKEDTPIAQVPPLLKQQWPRHQPYRDLDGQKLRAWLAECEVHVPKTGNRHPLNRGTVLAALARDREDT